MTTHNYYWRTLVENNKQRIWKDLGLEPEVPRTEEDARQIYLRWCRETDKWDIVERYKRAEPDLQLRVMVSMIVQTLGQETDGRLPLEMLQSLIDKYLEEYRKSHPSLIHGC